MENQINVSDQNTQQVGRNPVIQPTQIPEKPKINYWIISTIVLIILLVSVIAGGIYYQGKSDQANKDSRQAVTKPTGLTPTSNTKNSLTFSDETHIQFEYPSSWKVGKFEHFPEMFTLQPTENFVPESESNSILISISNHCLNTQCLTIFNLDDMVKNMGAKIITPASAKNVTGYKVTLSDGKTGYVFIKGDDFVTVSTDRYVIEMEQVILTLQLLSSDSVNDKNTKSWQTFTNSKYNYSLKYPSDWKIATQQIEYYDLPTLVLTKSGGKKMLGGYELPQLWIGSFEIYSTSGAICANEPYCEKVDKISFSIKGKSYSTDVFKRQVWESGKFTGNYFYVFQIGANSELDSIPSKPTITGQFETPAEKSEIENILSSINY